MVEALALPSKNASAAKNLITVFASYVFHTDNQISAIACAITKKMGLSVESSKNDTGERT